MASSFQRAIKDIRAQMATESAATVARIKEVETRLVKLADEMKRGFEDVGLALVAQTELELVAGFEERLRSRDQAQEARQAGKLEARLDKLDDLEARLARLEQAQPPAA